MESKPAGQTPTGPGNAAAERLPGNVFYLYKDTADLIARVNGVSVSVEDMLLASREIQKLPLRRCNRHMRADCLARLFKGQGDKALAIGYRLEAMARLAGSGKIRRWVRPNMVANVIFQAAATGAVRFRKNESFFELEPFLACVREQEQLEGVPHLALVPGKADRR